MNALQAQFDRLGGVEPFPIEPFIPFSPAELGSLEARIQAKLPADYAEFLLTYGGVRFGKLIVMVHPEIPLPRSISREGCALFDGFFGAVRPSHPSHSLEWNLTNYEDRMPDTIMAIGEAAFGDQICLGISGDEQGKVYFWDHNDEQCAGYYLDMGLEPPSDLLFRNVYPLANSFIDFIMCLKPYRDGT